MAYRIEYGDTGSVKLPIKLVRRKKTAMVAVAIGVVFLATLLIPQGRVMIRNAVLPGNEAVTAEALQGLASDLRAGEDLSDAVTTFCRYIISESET